MWKGGAETQLLKIARFLKFQNNDVMIISLKPINGFNTNFEEEGLRVVFLKNWKTHSISNCMLLYKAVKAFKPDVTIAFMFIAIIFARILKIRFKFNLISSIRTSVLPKKWNIPFRLTAVLDDKVVYNSHASKLNFENRNLVRKLGIVINNGIFLPELQCQNNVNSSGIFVWICIAHFKWNKDYLTLFKAIALLKQYKFRVDIIGNLNDEVWPFKVIKDLGIENHVRLLGFKPNASEYLRRAEAFVLSSFMEGMPNAILEAMAYRKPVVASAIDGNIELLQGANAGLLFEPANQQDLADKMVQVMHMSEDNRIALGRRGRNYIESNFSEAKVMSDWSDIISDYSKNGKARLNASV